MSACRRHRRFVLGPPSTCSILVWLSREWAPGAAGKGSRRCMREAVSAYSGVCRRCFAFRAVCPALVKAVLSHRFRVSFFDGLRAIRNMPRLRAILVSLRFSVSLIHSTPPRSRCLTARCSYSKTRNGVGSRSIHPWEPRVRSHVGAQHPSRVPRLLPRSAGGYGVHQASTGSPGEDTTIVSVARPDRGCLGAT